MSQGKAQSIFNKTVEPIFRAAKCSLDVTCSYICPYLLRTTSFTHIDTTHNKHATEIAKALSLEYDVLVTLGGDGIIHEVMNGFALHTQSAQAFDIPIAPIPTGSGNGTSLNLLGLEVRFV